jgi:hypothetical protein
MKSRRKERWSYTSHICVHGLGLRHRDNSIFGAKTESGGDTATEAYRRASTI